MKTITFDGASEEEAAAKKEKWLSEQTDVSVRATRTFPLAQAQRRFAKMDGQAPRPTAIEVDYETPN